MPTVWCPGCGIGIVFKNLADDFTELGYNSKDTTVISGIGCTGRMAGYFNMDTFHTTHGRPIPAAEAVKIYNPKLNVVVVSGDGDLLSIGGNHLLHAARRNTDITVIMTNNEVYGMTGGQSAPTIKRGHISQTAPKGSTHDPMNVQPIIVGNKRHFYARTTVFHLPLLKKCIREALEWKGFSFVEVITNCPERFGKMNKMKSPADMILSFKENYRINAKPKMMLEENEIGILKS